MSESYVTRQFDMLDDICWRFYGRTQGTVEAVMVANPNLAELLPILTEGITISLPDLQMPTTTETVRIWNE